MRGDGWIPENQAVGDIQRSIAYLAACLTKDVDAVVDCWGGRIVAKEEDLNPKHPVAPIDYTPELQCPILGLFGDDGRSPSPRTR